MAKRASIELSRRIRLIDGFDLGMPGRTGTYVLLEEEPTLIETGPSPSVPYIKDGLKALGLRLSDIQYVIVTHVHLDHAGGAGLLLKDLPNATVVVHPRGKRHLADPTKLVAGARAVYGPVFDDLFDPIVPIPEDRLVTKSDGETLKIGSDCELTFYDTPGHAKHHFSIYDPVSNGLFTGDTIGVRYHQTEDHGLTFYLPSTSPNHFDPVAMQEQIDRFRRMNLDRIYFGHFSVSEEPEAVYEQVSEWLPRFVSAGEQATANGEGVEGIKMRLWNMVTDFLYNHHIPENHGVHQILQLDFEVCAQGIADYLSKRAHIG